LTGNWRDEHIFALCQSLALFDFYQVKIVECDRKLEIALRDLADGNGHDIGRLPKVCTKTKQVNAPDFGVRSALYRVLGVDAKFSNQVQHRYSPELQWDPTMISSTSMSAMRFTGFMKPIIPTALTNDRRPLSGRD
jgi:hypothetical protein